MEQLYAAYNYTFLNLREATRTERMCPDHPVVLDIGGQDTKLIRQACGKLKAFFVKRPVFLPEHAAYLSAIGCAAMAGEG